MEKVAQRQCVLLERFPGGLLQRLPSMPIVVWCVGDVAEEAEPLDVGP